MSVQQEPSHFQLPFLCKANRNWRKKIKHTSAHINTQQKETKGTYWLDRTLVNHITYFSSVVIIVCRGLSVILQHSTQTHYSCLVKIINNDSGTICKWTSGCKAYVWVGELIFIAAGIFGKMIRNQQTWISTATNLL